MHYLLRSYSIPTVLEEEVAGVLWAAGTLGFQVVGLPVVAPEAVGGERPDQGEMAMPARVRIEAYFPLTGPGDGGADGDRNALPPLDPGEPGYAAADPLGRLAEIGVECLGAAVVPEQDWLAPWREKARPFDLGRGFRVDPREPDADPEPGGPATPGDAASRRLLRLPARAAFGVGSHESTRLALELLEELPLAGREVLDVGTGTGILAFAALHLGARRAVAFDLDPAAAVAARDNALLNRLYPLFFCGSVDAVAAGARFDWALVNVVPELILPSLPALATLAPGMVLSGILVEKGPEVLAAVGRLGFRETARAVAGDWIGFVVQREPAAHREDRSS